jgi:hypothetical protein
MGRPTVPPSLRPQQTATPTSAGTQVATPPATSAEPVAADHADRGRAVQRLAIAEDAVVAIAPAPGGTVDRQAATAQRAGAQAGEDVTARHRHRQPTDRVGCAAVTPAGGRPEHPASPVAVSMQLCQWPRPMAAKRCGASTTAGTGSSWLGTGPQGPPSMQTEPPQAPCSRAGSGAQQHSPAACSRARG